MRYINSRKEYLSLVKLNESGPLSNDIEWGDSLLGRLLNATARKAKIEINYKKIDNVIEALYKLFDEIVAEGFIMSDELNDRVNRLFVYKMLIAIKEKVDSANSTKENILEDAKFILASVENNFQENGGKIDSTKPEYVELVKRLKSLIEELSIPEKSASNKLTSMNLNLEKFNDMVRLLNATYNISLLGTNVNGTPITIKNTYADSSILEKDMKKYKKEFANRVKNGNATTDNNQDQEANAQVEDENTNQETSTAKEIIYDLKMLVNTIKPFTSFLIQKDKDYVQDMKSLIETPNNDLIKKHKERIAVIYHAIVKTKVNESLDVILSDGQTLAKKISELYKRLMVSKWVDESIDKETLNTINQFKKTFQKVRGLKNVNEQISNFKSFNEAVGDAVWKIFNAEHHFIETYIQTWFVEESELEKELGDLKIDKEKFVINGVDKIIEIAQLFNRAYRLHTWAYIPSGRSNGRVSQATLREYDHIGSGNPPSDGKAPGFGPWRNRKIYDKWEMAVYGILKKPEYQVLFNKNTVIQVNSTSERQPDIRKEGGRTLLKFINSLLDGDAMYKSGAQSKFISEYFELTVDDKKLGYKDDMKKNAESADKVKELELSFAKKDLRYVYRGVLGVKTRLGDKVVERFFFIQGEDNNNVYMKYYTNLFHLRKSISAGSILYGEMRDSEPTSETLSDEVVHYLAIPKPLSFDNREFAGININDFNFDSASTNKVMVDVGEVQEVFILQSDGKDFSFDPSVVISSKTENDGRAYNEYKSIILR